MGAKQLHLGGARPGDYPVNPNTTAYVQGQPLEFNTSGQLQLCTCFREGYDDGYAGLAIGYSGSATIIQNPTHPSDLYNGNAAYYMAFNLLKLDNTDPRNTAGDDYPYDRTRTYQAGDDIYINDVGKLTNVNPGGGGGVYDDVCLNATPIAFVTKVASSYLEIQQVR